MQANLETNIFSKTLFDYFCGHSGSRIEWLRISMDRISDSDSEDAGSIPAGATCFTRTSSKALILPLNL